MAILLFAAAGAVLGFVAALINGQVTRRLGPSTFWESLPELTKALATQSESGEFAKLYGQLVRGLVRYLVRNALLVGLSFGPVVIVCVALGPWALKQYHRSA